MEQNIATVSLIRGVRKGTDQISCRIYFKGIRKQRYIRTGVSVPEKYWIEKLQKINPAMKDSVVLQNQLDSFLYRVGFALEKMKYDEMPIEPETFLQVFHKRDPKTKPKPSRGQLLHLFCAQALEDSNLGTSSKKSQAMSIKLIREFNPTLTFDEIGYDTAVAWDKFLHEKYTNMNTIANQHKVLRKFLNEAVKKDLLTSKQYHRFKELKAPRITGTREALYPTQVKAIEDLDYPPFSTLDNVRNLFLFGCYTGLRISDLTTLSKDDIVDKNERGVLVEKEVYKLRKFNRKVYLPIEKLFAGKPLKLVEKYMAEYPDNETVFRVYSQQILNKYLKRIAHDAKISMPITFHYARHTFLTILALKTKDLFAVMDYGGITSVNTAQGYIHMASKWIDEGLKSIDWTLGEEL